MGEINSKSRQGQMVLGSEALETGYDVILSPAGSQGKLLSVVAMRSELYFKKDFFFWLLGGEQTRGLKGQEEKWGAFIRVHMMNEDGWIRNSGNGSR